MSVWIRIQKWNKYFKVLLFKSNKAIKVLKGSLYLLQCEKATLNFNVIGNLGDKTFFFLPKVYLENITAIWAVFISWKHGLILCNYGIQWSGTF